MEFFISHKHNSSNKCTDNDNLFQHTLAIYCMLHHSHLKWYANSTLLKVTICKNQNNSSTNLLQYLLFWETLGLPDHFWSWRPKNTAIFSTHAHTHTHTHNQSNNLTHCWDINNSYFSTLSMPAKIWQFTIKMVVTSKVAL